MKWYERTYKDGKRDGLWTEWYENELKAVEVNYKDGKEDGLYTHWWGDGQKKTERIYKDGELISEKQYKKMKL